MTMKPFYSLPLGSTLETGSIYLSICLSARSHFYTKYPLERVIGTLSQLPISLLSLIHSLPSTLIHKSNESISPVAVLRFDLLRNICICGRPLISHDLHAAIIRPALSRFPYALRLLCINASPSLHALTSSAQTVDYFQISSALLYMDCSEFTELIPGLTEELGLEFLTRLHYTAHRAASGVCRRWRGLIKSQEFYHHRKKYGYTHKVACLAQASPGITVPEGQKSSGSPSYSITVFDPASRNWERVDPIPKYPNGLPLFCQLTSSEGKLVVMGGWDPTNYDPVTDVFVYDFTSREWKQGKDMPSKRSFFAIGCWEGKVLVAGGHDESKNALKSAWVYDLGREEWTELTQMSQERDECEGIVIGNKFWVVSGYRTESQGLFEESAELYELEMGEWQRIEEAWEAGQCPRSCVGAGQDGRIVNWGKAESAIQVGTCGVMMGSRGLMIGSEYQGGAQGIYMVEMKQGEKWRLEKIDMDECDEFYGFVQSGCCVEI